MDITVTPKNIWGKELFYPVSDDAKFLADLMERPAFLKRHLKKCDGYGWDISVIYPIDFQEKA